MNGHDVAVITAKQKEVNDKWDNLNEFAKQRKEALASEFLVHNFKK